MKGQLRLLPGSIVLNQDSAHPMTGSVIASPDGQYDTGGFIWVHWVDGRKELEDPSELILTAQLFVEFPR